MSSPLIRINAAITHQKVPDKRDGSILLSMDRSTLNSFFCPADVFQN